MAAEKRGKRKLGDEQADDEKAVASVVGGGANFFPAGRLKSADIRKIVIEHLRQNQYGQLKKELLERGFLSEDKIGRFFLKEGHLILSWALIAETDQPLGFLAAEDSIVPKKTLRTILREENFAALRQFLCAQTGLEGTPRYTPKFEELQIKKFKILLGLDDEAVSAFMQENANDPYLQTPRTKANFAKAAQQFADENVRPEMP